MRCMVLALWAFAAIASEQALSHEVRPAYLEINETAPDTFEALWKQPRNGTLVVRLEPQLSNGLLDGLADEAYAGDNFVIRRWKAKALPRKTFDGAILRIEGLEHTLIDALVSIHFCTGEQVQTVLKPTSPQFTVNLTSMGKLPVRAYLLLGVDHILAGLDHLSFVLALVLLVRGRWRLIKTITSFTVAHTITLAAAVLGYVRVNTPAIELLVALSVLFVAVELARLWRGHEHLTAQYPWLIAFMFGLLHGFAFAGSLADVGLPPNNIPDALVLFNCGVELGQLLFVGAALFVIVIVRRLATLAIADRGRWLVPYSIGTIASYWILERVFVLAQG